MAFIAPIPQRSEMGFQPQEQQSIDPSIFQQTMHFLSKILNAPGADALMGGPWGAAGMVRPFFHGTSESSVNSILGSGFDLGKAGTGADRGQAVKGFYGKGVYVSPDADVAMSYAHPDQPAVLRLPVEDSRLFDMTNHRYDALLGFGSSQRAGDMQPVVKSINRQARKLGKGGVMYPGGETVIFDPSIIQSTERYK